MNNKFGKALRDYMKLPYTVMLKRDEEGDIIARVKEFEGCVADGQDEIEALGNLEKVKELWITAALNAGREIPKPDDEEELPSGKWLTRVPRSLHKHLIDLAKQEGVSLNQFVAVALAETVGRKAAVARKSEMREASLSSIHGARDYGISLTTPPLRIVYSKFPTAQPPHPEEAELFLESFANQLSNIDRATQSTSKRGVAVAW